MPGHDPDVRLFLGLSKSGKSHLARAMLQSRARVLIHDPNAEEGHAAGAVVVDTQRGLYGAIAAAKGGPVRLCWRGMSTMDPREAFEWANRMAWAGEGFTVVWDEVDTATTSGRLPPWAYKIINAGRHRDLSVFALSRRPARVPTDIRDAATRICVFNTTGASSLGMLGPIIGEAAAAELPKLKRYHAVDWQPQGWKIKKSPFM